MLYPDLRRLSLVHTCPTGMPGTNQAESSGSNDPPPPPPAQAGPAQREALGKRDVVETILRNLGDGNYKDACRVAARWCSLNSEHMAVCDDGVWKQLTRAVFPGTRAPDPRNHEPERPKDWFFYLCDRHARTYELIRFAMYKRDGMEEYHKKRAMTREEVLAPIRERIASVEEQIRESNMPGAFITHNKLSRLKRLLQDLKTELATMEEKRIRNLHKSPFANSDEDDPARLMGEYAQLEAWLRGLYEDPNADPFAPFRPWLFSHWEPGWGVWKAKAWW
tara:strand:+ start:186 stop:1019 length:834 start_codon:yes stop_codon:yes gene_type:complete